MKSNSRRWWLAVTMIAAAVGVSACGGSDGDTGAGATGGGHDMSTMSGSPSPSASGSPAAGPHNEADVMFATGMIPHHGQAIEMADMALGTATDPGVKNLAQQIKAAQNPEIAQMSGWLAGWGKPVPSTSSPGMEGHNMSDMESGGMMSEADMVRLGKATGAEFDRLWLTMMVEHHRGAVAMSQAELRAGQNPEAQQLAQAIIDGQTQEIATMTGMLKTL